MGIKVIKKIPAHTPIIKRAIQPVMPKIASYLQSCADRKIKNGVQPENSALTKKIKRGDKTLRDSGNLAASIASHHGELWASASTNLKYAKILQLGGIIKSKGKGLWIPASDRTRTLYRQYGATSPGSLIEKMKGDGYTFFYTSLSRVFCAVKGKRGKPFALFLVKSSIRIPARPFLYINDAEEKYIVNHIQRAIHQVLRQGRDT